MGNSVSIVLLFNTEPEMVSLLHQNVLCAPAESVRVCQTAFVSLENLTEIIISQPHFYKAANPGYSCLLHVINDADTKGLVKVVWTHKYLPKNN